MCVALSSARFAGLCCTAAGTSVTVRGAPGEAVAVIALRPDEGQAAALMHTLALVFPATGSLSLILG
jgi:hypothetical protein